MNPPAMASWNLALRFGLELAALAGLGLATWRLSDGPTRWALTMIVPVAASAVWGIFNVPDDPSRSGSAPVAVGGWTRLGIEFAILGGGAAAVVAGNRSIGIMFALLIAIHYAASRRRLEWLTQK